ncbi:MAG: efflux RND transporter permease subunit [Gemmatimonadaceae bacterium]
MGQDIRVVITLDDKDYSPPKLPARSEHSYFPDELDTLSPGAGWKTMVADAAASALTGSSSWAGVLPILWSQGTGADVIKRIAAPMVGGMITSPILTLVVIPAIYSLWKERFTLQDR